MNIDNVLRTHGIGVREGLKEFFGDGSDGELNTTGNILVSNNTSEIIGVRKQYSSIRINKGHTFTVSNPVLGVVLYSKGDVIIDGTIDLSNKGITYNPISTFPFIELLKLNPLSYTNPLRCGDGGNGGDGGGYLNYKGSGGIGTQGTLLGSGCGGGGAGGGCGISNQHPHGYEGGEGYPLYGLGGKGDYKEWRTSTTYGSQGINGSGGGGASICVLSYEDSGFSGWCRAGNGGSGYISGGGGAGGASIDQYGSGTLMGLDGANGEYGGGKLLIIAKGNVIINGSIYCKGGKGGNGSNGTAKGGCASGGGGGGGAGGGSICIYHKGTYTSNGTLNVDGGLGGSGGNYSGQYQYASNGNAGTAGTVGAIKTIKL